MAKPLVVVRSVGERTTDLVVEMLKQQCGAEPVLIANLPFAAALSSCFDVGIQSGSRLLITCDADVIPYYGAVEELIKLERGLPPEYFEATARFRDYLTGMVRHGGIRIYRTEYLGVARNLIRDSDPKRPESSTLRAMAKLGFPSASANAIICDHGREQFFRDIYRTTRFFAHKHGSRLERFVTEFRSHESDPDSLVALAGLGNGIARQSVEFDRSLNLEREIEEVLQRLCLTEKLPLTLANNLELLRSQRRVVSSNDWHQTDRRVVTIDELFRRRRRALRDLIRAGARKSSRTLERIGRED